MEITSYLLGKKAGGGETPTGTIEIIQNGITNVSSYASADVNVQPNLETKSITITENTTTTLTPTSGKDGMSSVEITTNVSGGGGGTPDWSTIGYSSTPQSVITNYNYSVQVKNEYTSSKKYTNDGNLVYMPLVDTSSRTDFSAMFSNCQELTDYPQLDTANGTNFQSMFASCRKLSSNITLDISKATTLNSTFMTCDKIPQITLTDSLQTGNGIYDMQQTFSNCYNLVSLTSNVNTSNCTAFINTFLSCNKLVTIPDFNMSKAQYVNNFCNNANLENVGRLIDLGANYSTSQAANYSYYTLSFTNATKLTHTSLMNIINNIYDIATKGCNTQKLSIGETNLAKLTAEEIAIATNKGWTVS